MKDKLLVVLGVHIGKIFGSIMGLILGWIVIRYGVIKGLFVVLCVAIGFYVGAKLDSPNGELNISRRFF